MKSSGSGDAGNSTHADEQRLYPKVRFRGFDEPWKKVKLGRNVKRIRRKNKNLETNIPLTISAQFGLVDQRDFFGRVVASENLANYILLKRGEFAYNKSYSKEAPYGSIKRLEKYNEGALSTLYIAFTPENINSDFLKAFFDTTKWYSHIVQVSTEGARNHGLLNISPQDFFEMSITIPKSDEQNNISRIYNLMNSLLSLQQRKLELISALEKGLGQIIKQQNNKYGITFSLNNFLEIPPQIQARIKNKNQLLTVKLNLQGLARGVQRDTLSLGSTKYFIRHTGELIFGKQNIFNGSIALITKEFDGLATSNDVPSLKISNINPQFLFYLLKNPDFWKHTELIATGTGSKRVHIHDLLKLHIKIIPDAKYQAKIVSLSRNFEKIVLNQQIIVKECEKTKQFLLQNLFI